MGAGVPLERGRQRGVPPLKRRYFADINCSTVKTVVDRYIHVAYHSKHWSRILILSKLLTLNDFELPKRGFSKFLTIFRLKRRF